MTTVLINGSSELALFDTGSSVSLVSRELVQKLKIVRTRVHAKIKISLASSAHRVNISSMCVVDLTLKERLFKNMKFYIVEDLCAPVLLGLDILGIFSKVVFSLGGNEPTLSVCALTEANVKPSLLFTHLDPKCRPIASRYRKYSKEDKEFIKTEVSRLLSEGVVRPSSSPWRAQIVVVKQGIKKRLAIDYSETINKFTYPNAYPIPRISDMVQNLAKYSHFSRIDLKSAYHQIPIPNKDKPFTAFEANGALYEFNRIPFGVTNGVACFQEILDNLIRDENLKDTYAYLDDVTIGGRSQNEHDSNLNRFLSVATKYRLTINDDKSLYNVRKVAILGHLIENKQIKPDPSRLKPLLDLSPPTSQKSMKRAAGLFAHYSKWIPNFSEKLQCMMQSSFPLDKLALQSFNDLKSEISSASLYQIDDDAPFTVETDASENAIAAVLTQDKRPVAFFARSLSGPQRLHSSVEKEASAIVEALKYWRHFLLGKRFTVITDQKSVSYIFGNETKGKIKNEKLLRWRLELSAYSFEIQYRPGKFNFGADALSRDSVVSASVSKHSLSDLHESLGHPGITRLYHFIKIKNLPFSLDEVKRTIDLCKTCAEVKPKFVKYTGTLITATRPLQRISLDFKGPVPSSSKNKYLLTAIDEYSRFPFAFPVCDTSSETVIKCLCSLFCLVGMPETIHTDRGTGFTSGQLKEFLFDRGIALTHSTPYNPKGNSQIERYNGIIWKTILLYLKSKNLDVKCWEVVLPDCLHSIRSLLCTSINETPHERFFNFS